MADGTPVFCPIDTIGYLSVQLIVEVAFGVRRALILFINFFMAFIAGVVVEVFFLGINGIHGKEKIPNNTHTLLLYH
jgi:hypothetical protein